MKTLYKVLVDGKSCHGGTMEWPLPENGNPGAWVEVPGKIEICKRGIHLTTSPFTWYKHGCKVYEAEAPVIAAWEGDKCVTSRARLLREVPFPEPWQRVERFLDTVPTVSWFKPDGDPNPEWKLFTATAKDAAKDAAWAAAWAAARDAAKDAAWDAAKDAAWAAAKDAAWAAAWAAARDAAKDAAKDAAWDAAGAAARAAAGAAARAAAGAAAWDAALMARIELVRDTSIDPKHIAHAKSCWQVWQKGYALLCDVDGVLYVYAKGAAR